MAAPEGNKYNEKWDEETSIQFFKDSLELLKSDDSIVFIGSLATKMNTYRDLYSILLKKWDETNKDFRAIKKEIDSIIEGRLFEGALNNGFNAAVSIFGLKNNHNWKDKRETDHTTNGKDINETKVIVKDQSTADEVSKLLNGND